MSDSKYESLNASLEVLGWQRVHSASPVDPFHPCLSHSYQKGNQQTGQLIWRIRTDMAIQNSHAAKTLRALKEAYPSHFSYKFFSNHQKPSLCLISYLLNIIFLYPLEFVCLLILTHVVGGSSVATFRLKAITSSLQNYMARIGKS